MDAIVRAVAADCFIVVPVNRHTIIMHHAHKWDDLGAEDII